jgi:hypothetical protein
MNERWQQVRGSEAELPSRELDAMVEMAKVPGGRLESIVQPSARIDGGALPA